MAEGIGADATFELDNSSDVLTDISEHLTDASKSEMVDALESTHFGDSAKAYVPGLSDGTVSVEGDYDGDLAEHLDGIKGTVVDFRFRPQGVGAGLPEYTGDCFWTSVEDSFPVAELGKVSFELQVTGGITFATQ